MALNGRTAQASAANAARLPGATKFGNPSDERLVSLVLDPVLILNCESLLGKPVNVQLSTDANDVVMDASFTP